jgi:thiamine pyrophosphokinase
VGDLDSVSPAVLQALAARGIPMAIAPAAKDETDLELALARALDEGAQEIVICAALGGRVDHLLANVLLLARPELAAVNAVIADGPVSVRLLRGAGGHAGEEGNRGAEEPALRPAPGDGGAQGAHLGLEGAAGDLLSLLPVGGDARGVTTRGLVYPLRDETLTLGRARGVSNVFNADAAHVWLRAGLLLVVHTQSGTGS